MEHQKKSNSHLR
jgi:hypothetical protein